MKNMDMNRRAFYNLVRMNWLQNPEASDEAWPVKDYRSMHVEDIFRRLEELGIELDQPGFQAVAANFDAPEEVVDDLLQETTYTTNERDEIYLLIFELWRRFVPEKLALSIFCDELDHQIYLFDQGMLESDEAMQDSVARLQMILDENADAGISHQEIFCMVCDACANDLPSFLYDFISMQFDDYNDAYADELIEGFATYLTGNKWFELLEVRLLAKTEQNEAVEKLGKLVLKAIKDEDLPYNIELLALISQIGERKDFAKLVKKTVPLITSEQELQDLLLICSDFYRYLDLDKEERAIQAILDKRVTKSTYAPVNPNDPHLPELLKIISE